MVAACPLHSPQVSPQRIANAPLYFIISPRQVVRVEAQRSGGPGRQTETLPLSLWLAHKRAFLSLRRLTFFQCFSLTKCFARWRTNARLHVLRRRRRVLQSTLLPACPAFSEALLGVQAALYGRLRAVRTAAVQPGRRYTAGEWAEEQAAWRTHRAQPEVQEVVTELVRLAEAAVQRVEAEAAELERTVQPAELTDRIGVRALWSCPVVGFDPVQPALLVELSWLVFRPRGLGRCERLAVAGKHCAGGGMPPCTPSHLL